MKKFKLKKISAISAPILLGLLLMFKQWLPFQDALVLALGMPFFYFFPGFFAVKAGGFSYLDRIETIVLSLLLSVILFHTGIYILEENTRTMTFRDIVLTATLINVLCALTYLAHHKQLSRRLLLARLRGKFYKSHHKES